MCVSVCCSLTRYTFAQSNRWFRQKHVDESFVFFLYFFRAPAFFSTRTHLFRFDWLARITWEESWFVVLEFFFYLGSTWLLSSLRTCLNSDCLNMLCTFIKHPITSFSIPCNYTLSRERKYGSLRLASLIYSKKLAWKSKYPITANGISFRPHTNTQCIDQLSLLLSHVPATTPTRASIKALVLS